MAQSTSSTGNQPLIELRHVDKHYGDLHVLNGINLSVDRVVVMADGQIVETGTPDEVFDHPQTKRAQDFLNSIKGH